MKRWCSLWGLGLLLLGLISCLASKEGGDFVRRSLEAHRLADAALERGDLDEARTRLESIWRAQGAAGLAEADRRVILQDVAFRLAALEAEAGKPEVALARAEAGLALGAHEDLFTANLLIERGRACEALQRDAEAVQSYAQAMSINEKLLDEALAARGGQR